MNLIRVTLNNILINAYICMYYVIVINFNLMKNLAILFTLIITLIGCKDTSNFEIGYTTPGIPISISLNTSGTIGLNVGARWISPVGVFSIGQSIPNYYLRTHRTKIIIKETSKNQKYFYELLEGESFNYSDKHRTDIKVEEKYNSTIVTIESDEINHFLKVARVTKPKPKFPDTPLAYFWLTKKINVDWTINSVSDLFLDILYIIIYFFTILFDLILILLLFVLRLVWFIIIGVMYIIGTILD